MFIEKKMKMMIGLVVVLLATYMQAAEEGSDLSKGLIGYYQMEELWTGNGAEKPVDSSTMKLQGSLKGKPSTTEDEKKVGKRSGYFSMNDAIFFKDVNTFNFDKKSFTFATWIKTDHKIPAKSAGFQRIFQKYDYKQPKKPAYFLRIGKKGKVSFMISGGPSFFGVTSKTAVNDGKWHLIVAVFENNTKDKGSDSITIWIDGVKEKKQTEPGDYVVDLSNNGNASISVMGQGVIGFMDEVAVWNRALNKVDIEKLYNKGNGITLSK